MGAWQEGLTGSQGKKRELGWARGSTGHNVHSSCTRHAKTRHIAGRAHLNAFYADNVVQGLLQGRVKPLTHFPPLRRVHRYVDNKAIGDLRCPVGWQCRLPTVHASKPSDGKGLVQGRCRRPPCSESHKERAINRQGSLWYGWRALEASLNASRVLSSDQKKHRDNYLTAGQADVRCMHVREFRRQAEKKGKNTP